MKTIENAHGCDTIVLEQGDSLVDVPLEHKNIAHAEIVTALAAPVSYFQRLARNTPFTSFGRWLHQVVTDGKWELELHLGYADSSMAGFFWECQGLAGATIGLPNTPDLGLYPPTVQRLYQDIDAVQWNGFGCGGSLYGAKNHMPLSAYNREYQGADVDLNETYIWGDSPCGDMLVYTDEDKGGWVNHETGTVHLLGSTSDTINWIFDQLLAGKSPDYDHAWG